MHRLAQVLERLARARGAQFRYGAHVARIAVESGRAKGVVLQDGTQLSASAVLFNGDPRALATGRLGERCRGIARATRSDPRSLSAEVWAFAATPEGPDLAHHNVFFRQDPREEFEALAQGRLTEDPTLYVCAQDRGLGTAPPALERFEIIANAPPLKDAGAPGREFATCHRRVFETLAGFGLSFDPLPGPPALSQPTTFERLFPASLGALYGQSPHGTMAAFRRPVARTRIKGLYLAGGGTHPGAGVPMATLSARHAAEAILSDRISTLRFRRTAMPGGMSTGSATAVPAPSASSGS